MIEVVDGQRKLEACKRIVVKIGSSLLTANGQGLDIDAISHWAKQIADPVSYTHLTLPTNREV